VDSVAKRRASAATDDRIDPVDLRLDTKNPRFAAYHSGGKRKEREIIAHLLENDDLMELVESIASNGYVDLEPLIVVDEDDDGTLTVVEGNRRIAALKLLRDRELAGALRVKLPSFSSTIEGTFDSVTVRSVDGRDEARQYIGFKHINGPHKWDAFAKGKFAADWYRVERKNGMSVREVARRLGDRHDTIVRLVNGIFVLDQAKKAKIFDIEDRPEGRPFFFSHLYVALTRSPYREYLGLDPQWRQVEPVPDPIPQENLPRLKKVLIWLYGSDDEGIEPLVKSQNPHVKQLGEILANSVALKRLESGGGLSKAYSEVDSREKRFEDALLKAVKHAEDAQQYVDGYDGDAALMEYAIRLGKIGQILSRTMKESAADATGPSS
jgi:hypothetical protein